MVYDQLLDTQRYSEAAAAKPFDDVLRSFDQASTYRPNPTTQANPMIAAAQRRRAIRIAVEGMEVFAGAGNFVAANALVENLLDYDNSSGTVALIQTHLGRAGHPELIVLHPSQQRIVGKSVAANVSAWDVPPLAHARGYPDNF